MSTAKKQIDSHDQILNWKNSTQPERIPHGNQIPQIDWSQKDSFIMEIYLSTDQHLQRTEKDIP